MTKTSMGLLSSTGVQVAQVRFPSAVAAEIGIGPRRGYKSRFTMDVRVAKAVKRHEGDGLLEHRLNCDTR